MIGFVPTLEFMIEDQVQFQMHMGAFAIDPGPGVTHYRNVLPALRHVTGADIDLTQVPIQAVIRRTVPNMFDDDVLAVIRITGNLTRVDNLSVRNRAHFVARFAVLVAMDRKNIDSFVEPGINNSFAGRLGIAHESVLTAFPRGGFLAMVIALDVLIKRRTAAV